MVSTQSISLAMKPQGFQPVNRIEYFSYDMKAWNRLQSLAANRPILGTAAKIFFAAPALLADLVRNVIKAVCNLPIGVANLGIGTYNAAHRLFSKPAVQPAAPKIEPLKPAVQKGFVESEISLPSSSLLSQEEIIIQQIDVTLFDDRVLSASELESEDEVAAEPQVQPSGASFWLKTAGVATAAAAVVFACTQYQYFIDLYNRQ